MRHRRADHLEKLTLVDNRTGDTEDVSCGRMFIFIGAAPRTEWLDGVLARDDHGFILTGPDLRNVCGWTLDRPPHHLETSVPGVFVAGDVRSDVRQTGRGRGRRRIDGRDAGPPLPVGVMTS